MYIGVSKKYVRKQLKAGPIKEFLERFDGNDMAACLKDVYTSVAVRYPEPYNLPPLPEDETV